MTVYALLFTLSAIGISETAYLIKKRLLAEKPFCVIGDDCALVFSSKYSRIFIIPNDVMGLLFYVFTSFLTAFLVIGVEPVILWDLLMKLTVVLGAIMSLFFTYLQWKVIKAWCFWCLMSAFTIWLMAIIILIDNFI